MHIRNWMALAHDVAAAALAWYLAYWLRFNTEIPPANLDNMAANLLWIAPLQALVFFIAGMYRGMWRYASVPDLQRIAAAVIVSILAIGLVLVMLPPQTPPVPRSVMMMDPILLVMLLGGSVVGRKSTRLARAARHRGDVPGHSWRWQQRNPHGDAGA